LAVGPGFEEVLAAAQAGAPWALQRLYEDLAPVVTGYLRLRGAIEPDDLASETFLNVFHTIAGFRGDEAAFRSWVFTIAHHRMVDDWRRRGRRPVTEPLDAAPAQVGGDVEVEALSSLGSTWMRDALEALSEEQREVLLLRIVADLSVAEVAAIVGKRAGAVRALQHRGLERLRRHLAAQRVANGDREDADG
jgi:RNA polymerase sigma-70 factor (ECF subfamily)